MKILLYALREPSLICLSGGLWDEPAACGVCEFQFAIRPLVHTARLSDEYVWSLGVLNEAPLHFYRLGGRTVILDIGCHMLGIVNFKSSMHVPSHKLLWLHQKSVLKLGANGR